MTVSNVLGGRAGFTSETRDRVLAAADQLNYRPNRSAQRLRSNRSHQLGLHMPAGWLSVREPFAVSFLRSVTEAAERAGQQVVVFSSELQEESVRGLVQSGVDGFVLCNVGEDDPRPHVFTDLGIPFVIMGRLEASLPQNSVDVDNVAAMAMVVDHLVAAGHQRFAYVGAASPFYAEAEREAGTVDRLGEHGLKIPKRWRLRTTVGRAGDQATKHLLGDDRPDAVICSSDALAVRVHAAIKRAGLEPGRDIALTGFDALELPYDLDPPLTSVRLPLTRVTRSLVELLLQLIDGEATASHRLIVPAELSLGGTG